MRTFLLQISLQDMETWEVWEQTFPVNNEARIASDTLSVPVFLLTRLPAQLTHRRMLALVFLLLLMYPQKLISLPFHHLCQVQVLPSFVFPNVTSPPIMQCHHCVLKARCPLPYIGSILKICTLRHTLLQISLIFSLSSEFFCVHIAKVFLPNQLWWYLAVFFNISF